MTFKGERYRAQFPTEQQALQWEADTRAALIAGRPLPQAPTGANETVTLGDMLKRTVLKYWKGTKNELRATLNAQAAVDHFGANTPLKDLTAAKVDEYGTVLAARGLSGATVNRYLAALSKMLTYARRIEVLDKVPYIERHKEGAGRERFLKEHEADAILATMSHRGKAAEELFTLFLLDTGCRLGEGLSVRVGDVGADRVTIGSRGSAKNGEWRVVPMTRRLQLALAPYILGRFDDEVLFHNINRATYHGFYRKVCDHLKLGSDVVIHTLRHTCASWLVQRGVDIRRVQLWMGHKSIQVTLRYAKLAPVDLFEAVKVLDAPPQRTLRRVA